MNESVIRATRYVLVGIAWLAIAGECFLAADAKAALSKLDAKLLRTGRFHYRILEFGKDVGTSDIFIRKSPGSSDFIYTNDVAGQFAQRWEAIATSTFKPISATLSFGEGDKARRAFALKYQSGRVVGSAWPRQRSGASDEVKVDSAVLSDTVDQRIDWAAAMSQELVPGHEFAFHVFDPGTGNSRVTGRIVGRDTVRIPAGTFEAIRIEYHIEKSGGRETYQLLTNSRGPRMMLKMEFPTGVISELVKVSD